MMSAQAWHEGSSTEQVTNSGGTGFLHSQQAPEGLACAWAAGALMVWMTGTAQRTPPAMAPRLRTSRRLRPWGSLSASTLGIGHPPVQFVLRLCAKIVSRGGRFPRLAA